MVPLSIAQSPRLHQPRFEVRSKPADGRLIVVVARIQNANGGRGIEQSMLPGQFNNLLSSKYLLAHNQVIPPAQ